MANTRRLAPESIPAATESGRPVVLSTSATVGSGLRRGCYQRQLHVKNATFSGPSGGLHPDPAPVALHDSIADGEAEPQATEGRSMGPPEALEDELLVLPGDAKTAVPDPDVHPISGGFGIDLDRSALR